MNWMSDLLYGLLGTSVCGTAVSAVALIFSHFILSKQNRWGEINWALKWAALSYLCPLVLFLLLYEDMAALMDSSGAVRLLTAADNKGVRFLFALIIMAWVIGTVKGIFSYISAKRTIARGMLFKQDADEAVQEICAKICRRLKYKGKYNVYRWRFYDVPIVAERNTILLPERKMSEKELEICLAHELNHIKRKDLLWRYLLNIICIVHWFNPAVYFVRREFILWSEVYCDVCSLLALGRENCSKRTYFSTILKLCSGNAVPYSSIGLADSLQEMKSRISHIQKFDGNPIDGKKIIPVTAGMLLLFAGFSIASQRAIQEMDSQILDRTTEIIVVQNEEESDAEIFTFTLSAEEYAGLGIIPVGEAGMADPYDFRMSIPAGKMYRSERAFELEEGDIVNISAICRGDDLSYQVGIIGTGGEAAAIEGARTVGNDFEISRDGTYHIWLGNMGKESIDVMVVAETIP